MTATTIRQDNSDDPDWERLRAVAAMIGRDTGLVQGAGGNISLKRANVLWVKASGKWMADADNDEILVPLALDCARARVASDNEDFLSCLLDAATLKPSIETGMHAVLPHRVVLHVHSVNVLCHAVLDGGQADLKRLLAGISWRWIPYCRPGAPLTRAIRAGLGVDAGSAPVALVLVNHGLVVAAESIDGVLEMLNAVERAVHRPARVVEVASDRAELDKLAAELGARLPFDDAVAALALDELALKVAALGTLYPDHVVFLGALPTIRNQEEMTNFSWASCATPYVIVRGVGVLVKNDISANAEAMLGCWADLALRITDVARISPLSEASILELTGWDAEKYRQSLARAE